MASRNQSEDLTIREIEYSIFIKDKDRGFHDLHDILRSELTRFENTRKKTDKTENPIREFLKTNIDRSIVIRDSTRVYFLEYIEQGSFTIQFKLLVITRYINYGSTRQALDFLIKDTIGDYFEELLERHLPASVSVHSVDNELYDIPGYSHEINYPKPGPKRDYLSVILASLALFFTLTIGLIWVIQRNPAPEIKKPSDEYKDKYFELLIDKQINDALNKEKLNMILYKNLLTPTDPDSNLKSQHK
jgi:hypothetical protein